MKGRVTRIGHSGLMFGSLGCWNCICVRFITLSTKSTGYPLSTVNECLIVSSSAWRWLGVQMLRALRVSVAMIPALTLAGWLDSKCMYWLVWVGFLYTDVSRELAVLRMYTSRNGNAPSCSVSLVNCILLFWWLRWFSRILGSSSGFSMVNMSSTFLNQQIGVMGDVLMAFSSNLVMYISAISGERGEPIGRPLICW